MWERWPRVLKINKIQKQYKTIALDIAFCIFALSPEFAHLLLFMSCYFFIPSRVHSVDVVETMESVSDGGPAQGPGEGQGCVSNVNTVMADRKGERERAEAPIRSHTSFSSWSHSLLLLMPTTKCDSRTCGSKGAVQFGESCWLYKLTWSAAYD